MADDTYQPLVYMKQGGNELVVASGGLATVESGGEITIESGGTMDVESGGGIDVESGGDITVESGGKIIWPVSGATSSSIGSTTLSELTNNGISFITSSGDVRKLHIAAPSLGASKWLFNTAGSTGMVIYISCSDAGIITTGADSTAHLMIVEGTTSSALAGWCHLIGLSTSRWLRTAHSPTSQWVIDDATS